ncbi:hypothetical protein SUGI_0005720 [Cryptomeria japonica]|uniref:putative pectate lyase 21 n=1 Tax=Cryptomeria japonica TaxID=3369 RepID=UPI002408B8B3|nr:putative pectate lyase 21 [Cryptomeria japonica]GLJ04882.1 hypothetical protein SUGI_0005720 [Cryptomeria japonica]
MEMLKLNRFGFLVLVFVWGAHLGVSANDNCPEDADGTRCAFSACASGNALPRCAFGFASTVTGGAGGQSYVVTSSDDSPQSPQPGSLRYGIGKGNVWITFSQSMKIILKDRLWIQSSTTIDGRGFSVTIGGGQLVMREVSNVILHNLQIDAPTNNDQNSIYVDGDSTLVWMDHLTSVDPSRMTGTGKIISVSNASTDVTISNSLLANAFYSVLLGSSDEERQDTCMRVTVYRNWFKDSVERMPHCRWGYCHVVNNLYTNWTYFAIGARTHATIECEANVFEAGSKKEITPWDSSLAKTLDQTPHIDSKDDLLLNGATFHQFLKTSAVTASPPHKVNSPPVLPPQQLSSLLRRCAGALDPSQARACLAP